jgi:hypothetical protein
MQYAVVLPVPYLDWITTSLFRKPESVRRRRNSSCSVEHFSKPNVKMPRSSFSENA